jgi:hypothetical protein
MHAAVGSTRPARLGFCLSSGRVPRLKTESGSTVTSGGTVVTGEPFEIVVRGRLSPMLVAAIEGFEVRSFGDGLTRLVGWIPDQARLFGLFTVLWELNIELESVNPEPAFPFAGQTPGGPIERESDV